jgi:transglutaminase-like putative cysteine protease
VEKVVYSMPRASLIWLLAAVSGALLPHLQRLPMWIVASAVVCVLWRIQVFRERWLFPNKLFRTLLVLAGTIGVIAEYGSLLHPAASVAMLILAYSFKLIEMHKRRDAYVVVILSFFVIATEFMFSEALLVSSYELAVVLLVTAALVAMNQKRIQLKPMHPLKISMFLVVQSLPLMVIFFILVPRTGPLWNVGLLQAGASSGLTDSMAPGDVTRLAKSARLVFRAEFEGPVPLNRQLYWRALTLDHFDGRTWTRKEGSDVINSAVYWPGEQRPSWLSGRLVQGQGIKYRVMQEPTGQKWLFGLPLAYPLDGAIGVARDGRLESRKPVFGTRDYSVISYLSYQLFPRQIGPNDWSANLQLPATGNDRAREYARAMFAKQGNDAESFAGFILGNFHTQPFVYTLNPPRLGKDTIDEFMFSSRKGFCAHYASAFVFLMRSAGIPARVVAGYQGGQVHPLGGYLLVHQYDAHAWGEIWVKGKGWIRYDPTGAVAPERIEIGAEGVMFNESFMENSPLSPRKFWNHEWVTGLRWTMDYVDYLWWKGVIGYDPEVQRSFLSGIIGSAETKGMILTLLAISVIFIGLMAFLLMAGAPKVHRDGIDKTYLRFCRKLEKVGLVRAQAEAPLAFAKRVSEENPELYQQTREITRLYVRLKYVMPDLVRQGSGVGEASKEFSKDMVSTQLVVKRFKRIVHEFKPGRR